MGTACTTGSFERVRRDAIGDEQVHEFVGKYCIEGMASSARYGWRLGVQLRL
jgi:hypothetical protein